MKVHQHLKFKGEILFKGDKSLSHRIPILAALSKGRSQITNFLPAQDTINTLKALEFLGVAITQKSDISRLEVNSEGKYGFRNPEKTINVGNSGTGARLFLGLLSGYDAFEVTLDGDETLRKRPMKRVTAPLSNFGAVFKPEDHLPITIYGKKLAPIFLKEELGSAQVKSACLLAALASDVPIEVQEYRASRDHTENLLRATGVDLSVEEKENGSRVIKMSPPYSIETSSYDIWGDISSASFFVVMALLSPGSKILIRDVLLNPFRTGYLNILKRMGAEIVIHEKEKRYNEKGGDVEVHSSHLKNITIGGKEVPSIIDELPILAIAGMFSEGCFEVRGAEELRYKESDRIHAICSNLRSLGYECEEYKDGFRLEGRPGHIPQGDIQGFKDHRILMSCEVANIIAQNLQGEITSSRREMIRIPTQEKDWIQTSFPDFYQKVEQLLLSGV